MGRCLARRPWLTETADELLRLAHRQALCEHRAEYVWLTVDGKPPKGSPVTFGQPSVGDCGLNIGMEVEEPKRVGHGRPGFANSIGDEFLGQPELVDQLPVGERLVDRIKVRALDVLHESDLELVAVGKLAHDGGDAIESGEASRSDAPLPGDQLVSVDRPRYEDRLEDAVLTDARGKLLELGLVDVAPGLERIRLDPGKRDLDDRGRRRWSLRDQCVQSAAERGRCTIRFERHAGDPASTDPGSLAGVMRGVAPLDAQEALARRARSSPASDA